MSARILIKCDRCGDEWEDNTENRNKQIWKIGIGMSCGRNSSISITSLKTQDWCRKCVNELQLIGLSPQKKKAESAPIEITFEEKVVELLNELGFYQEE